MTTTGSLEPKQRHRRLRVGIDIVAAAMIVTGAVLVGISVSQRQHYDHALAVQASRKAQVDRAVEFEAQEFRAQHLRATTRPETHQAPQTHKSPQTRHSGVSATIDENPPAGSQRPRTAALAPAANRQATPGPARRPPAPTGPRPAGVTEPGAVSEIRGTGAALVIPALQVRAPVVATGAVDGSMTIPADVHTVGWYDGADTSGGRTTSAPTPWPGQAGVSLLAGHINWVGQGQGALYYIGQLAVGDPIEVIGSNREATYWRVSQPAITISKANLPADLFVNTGPAKLALVTCGGPFDAATGHYLDNVIVWATLATR